MSRNVLGALLMMASMVCFTINDAFIKLTDGALPLAQLLATRGVLSSVMIVCLALLLGGLTFRLGGQAWKFICMRSVTEVGAAYFFLTALLNMPLANVTAILQALPLTVALGAHLVLKEPLGWRRMVAILVGFGGMLLIVRPGAEGFSVWSVYALVAVACVTARDLITRKMPGNVPSLTVATMNTLTVAICFGALSLTQPWEPMTGPLWTSILGSAVFVIGGYYFSVQVMRVGDVAFVAPFRYTSLLSALTLGWFVFGDWPDTLTSVGAGIIVTAGLFTLWRERRSAA